MFQPQFIYARAVFPSKSDDSPLNPGTLHINQQGLYQGFINMGSTLCLVGFRCAPLAKGRPITWGLAEKHEGFSDPGNGKHKRSSTKGGWPNPSYDPPRHIFVQQGFIGTGQAL